MLSINYDEKEDSLFIQLSNEKVIKDISYGWNFHVGVTEYGVGQITILNAKSEGLLPLNIPKKLLLKPKHH